MNMKFNRKYLAKMFSDPLPPLPEDERIYFNVTYTTRQLASVSNCRFDREKKLWFTGVLNSHLDTLVKFYGVHELTSENARRLLKEKLDADSVKKDYCEVDPEE